LWIVLALRDKFKKRADEPVSWPDVASAVIVCVCITGGLMVGAWMLGALSVELVNPFDDSLAFWHWLRWLIMLAPLVAGALYCLIATWWRQRKAWRVTLQNARETRAARPKPIASATPLLRRDMAPILKLAANWMLTIATIYLWLGCFVIGYEKQSTTLVVAALLLGACCVVRWAIKWFPVLAAHSGAIFNHSLHWYRKTLGVFLVLSSVVYLLLLLISLPPRRAAEATMDDYIRRGEMALLKDAARKP